MVIIGDNTLLVSSCNTSDYKSFMNINATTDFVDNF